MNKNQTLLISITLTPSKKEGVLFLYILLYLAHLSIAQGNYLYLLQMQLNDSVKLQLPIKMQSNKLIIPAYSDAIQYTSDILCKKDSMFTSVSIYENKFFLRKKNQDIEGIWVKYSGKKKYEIPCMVKKINTILSFDSLMMKKFPNQWKIKITTERSSYFAVGTFHYNQSFMPHLSGSIATPYGDLGDINGVINHDSLYLYAFNGAFVNALLAKIYSAKNHNIDSIKGYIYYGNWGVDKLIGVPDNQFKFNNQIPTESVFNNPEFTLSHQWIDIDGKTIQLQNNKPALIIFMGSWCPNCADEIKLFTQCYDTLVPKLQIIAFAIERTEDDIKAIELLKKYKQKLNVPFPIILLSAKGNVPPFEQFPEIIKIPAFPTSVYFNKLHKPFVVTTGFNGPATNQLYIQSKEHINQIIKKITE